MLFFALTGRVPFAYRAHEAKLWARLSEPPPEPSRHGAPATFDHVVARAMAGPAVAIRIASGRFTRAALTLRLVP